MSEGKEFDDDGVAADPTPITSDPDPETVFDDGEDDIEEEEVSAPKTDAVPKKAAPKPKKDPAKAPAKAKKALPAKKPAQAPKKQEKPVAAKGKPVAAKKEPSRRAEKVVIKVKYSDKDVLKIGKDAYYPFGALLKKAGAVSTSAYTRLANYSYWKVIPTVELYGYLWVPVKEPMPEGMSVEVSFIKA